MEQLQLVYAGPIETVKTIMMLYIKAKAIVRSPDEDKNFLDVVAGV